MIHVFLKNFAFCKITKNIRAWGNSSVRAAPSHRATLWLENEADCFCALGSCSWMWGVEFGRSAASGRTASTWSTCCVPETQKDSVKVFVLEVHLDKNLSTSVLFEPPFSSTCSSSSLIPQSLSVPGLPWFSHQGACHRSLPDFTYCFLMTNNCLLQKLWKMGPLYKDCHQCHASGPPQLLELLVLLMHLRVGVKILSKIGVMVWLPACSLLSNVYHDSCPLFLIMAA